MSLLAELAAEAMTTHAARRQLRELITRSGWFDVRVMRLVEPRSRKVWRRFHQLLRKPSVAFCRAVFTVEMFGAWSRRWAGVESSAYPPMTVKTASEILKRFYSPGRIQNFLFSPLFGIRLSNRCADVDRTRCAA